MDDAPWEENTKNPLGPQTLDPNAYANLNYNSTQKSLIESNFLKDAKNPMFIDF